MSKYTSKNNAFQFGLALFTLFGLSMGIILTTGKAPLNFFSSAQINTDYKPKPSVLPGTPIPSCIKDGLSCVKGKVCCGFCNNGVCSSNKCISDGQSCVKGQVCCGYCNKGKCESTTVQCIKSGSFCDTRSLIKCCSGKRCVAVVDTVGICQ